MARQCCRQPLLPGSFLALCSWAMSAHGFSFPELLDSWTVVPVVRSLVQLGVPDVVPEDGTLDPVELAARVGADPEMLHRALRYTSGFGVFREEPERSIGHSDVSLRLRVGGSLRKKVLYRASHESVMPYVDGFARVLQDPTKSAFEHSFGEDYFTQWLPRHPASEQLFGEYMSEASEMQIPSILAAYPWPERGSIADLGGGNGHLLRALLLRSVEVAGTLFDLPSTVETAKGFWPEGDVMRSGRVEYVAGDFFESLQVAADVYVLKWILHDWSDEKCRRLLANIAGAAKPASKVVVVDMRVPEDMPNAYHITKFFDMHMAAGFGGKERSSAQVGALAEAAGWRLSEVLAVGKSPFSCFVLERRDAACSDL